MENPAQEARGILRYYAKILPDKTVHYCTCYQERTGKGIEFRTWEEESIRKLIDNIFAKGSSREKYLIAERINGPKFGARSTTGDFERRKFDNLEEEMFLSLIPAV